MPSTTGSKAAGGLAGQPSRCHSILVVAYRILQRKAAYHDLGEDYFQQRQQQATDRYARRLVRQLEQLGHKVTLEPAATARPQPARRYHRSRDFRLSQGVPAGDAAWA